MRYLPIILRIIAVIFILTITFYAGFYYSLYNYLPHSLHREVPPTITEVRNVTEYIEKDLPEDFQIYASPTLGVAFIYTKSTGPASIQVKEVGNKIFLYQKSYEADYQKYAHYFQVFNKKAELSLKDAVVQNILSGIDSNCSFYPSSNASMTNKLSNYEYLSLRGIIQPNSSYTDSYEAAMKCSKNYTTWNGVSYFMMDTTHPEKFIFFNAGQSDFGGPFPKKSWESTVRILD